MSVRNVVRVMNFHALVRVDNAKKLARKYQQMQEELMHMMYFRHADIIRREIIHNLCQILIDSKEDIHTDTEVGCIEKGFPFLFTHPFYLLQMFQPTSCSGHYRDSSSETFHIIAISCSRSGKLNRHIRTLECFRLKVLWIVYIND